MFRPFLLFKGPPPCQGSRGDPNSLCDERNHPVLGDPDKSETDTWKCTSWSCRRRNALTSWGGSRVAAKLFLPVWRNGPDAVPQAQNRPIQVGSTGPSLVCHHVVKGPDSLNHQVIRKLLLRHHLVRVHAMSVSSGKTTGGPAIQEPNHVPNVRLNVSAILGIGFPYGLSVYSPVFGEAQWTSGNLGVLMTFSRIPLLNRNFQGFSFRFHHLFPFEAGDLLGSAIAEVAQQGVDAQWEPKLGEMMGGVKCWDFFLLEKHFGCFVVGADCFCLGGCWKLWKVEGYLFQLLGGGFIF